MNLQNVVIYNENFSTFYIKNYFLLRSLIPVSWFESRVELFSVGHGPSFLSVNLSGFGHGRTNKRDSFLVGSSTLIKHINPLKRLVYLQRKGCLQ